MAQTRHFDWTVPWALKVSYQSNSQGLVLHRNPAELCIGETLVWLTHQDTLFAVFTLMSRWQASAAATTTGLSQFQFLQRCRPHPLLNMNGKMCRCRAGFVLTKEFDNCEPRSLPLFVPSTGPEEFVELLYVSAYNHITPGDDIQYNSIPSCVILLWYMERARLSNFM